MLDDKIKQTIIEDNKTLEKIIDQYKRLLDLSEQKIVPMVELKKPDNHKIENYTGGKNGTLLAKFEDIVKVFGFPHVVNPFYDHFGGDGKTTVGWFFQLDDDIINIYDYKRNIKYEPDGQHLFEIDEWSIGSNNIEAVKKFAKIVEDISNAEVKVGLF